MKMPQKKFRKLNSERGASLIDYAILVSLIAIVSMGSLIGFRENLKRMYCEKVIVATMAAARGQQYELSLIPPLEDGSQPSYCINNDAENDENAKIF